jgi:hypothetical protein
MTCSHSFGGVFFKVGFFFKHEAVTFLYSLTSCMMLHKMASLQLIYPVTLLLPTFIYLTYHLCCWEHVTYFSHGILSLGWLTNANWKLPASPDHILHKIFYDNKTL